MNGTIGRRFATLIAAGLVALGAGTSASAGSMKTYPAAMCQSNQDSKTIDGNGYATNTSSSSSVTLICPIAKDPWVMGLQVGNVWVTDKHYSQNVCCSSRSKNPGGNALRFTSNQCSTGVQSHKALAFSGPKPAGTWSHRFYRCTVPPTYAGYASAVLTYRSQEL